VQFVALLRALGMVVDSYGVSHAQIERMLCERIAAGKKAEAMLAAQPTGQDQDRLRCLAARKDAVVDSGLARADGRRDKAGGQRVGELLGGKFPRNAMPPRRRVEVCVDVFLEVLADKDREGYAEGRYGSRELWFELWLEADQGHMPRLGRRAKTVTGYVEEARRQLAAPGALATAAKGAPGDDLAENVPQAMGTGELLAAVRTEAVEERRQREACASALRQALAERDQTLERARAAEAGAARAAARHRSARTRLVASSVALAVIAAGLIIALVIGLRGASAAGTVVFQFPVSRLLPGPPGVTVRLDLPSSSHHADWMFTIRLRLVSAVQVDACVHDSQLTYTLRRDGTVVASGRPAPGQPQITAGPLRVAGIGGGGHVLYLTVGVVVSPLVDCQFTLDPSGTSAYPG
jgi:hypothetical protein